MPHLLLDQQRTLYNYNSYKYVKMRGCIFVLSHFLIFVTYLLLSSILSCDQLH